MTTTSTVKCFPEGPRDPKLAFDNGEFQSIKQSLGEMPHADDDERPYELVAEDWNP